VLVHLTTRDADDHSSRLEEVITTVQVVGKKSVTVTLKKGTDPFQCDVHAASGMKGTFKVT
jgi:plastocyanin